MAIHQYIGARYVPKFYENSDGTSEWRSGVIYEPLTIVTWNSNSYTSKKFVPESVGAPGENVEYWVATGNYNAQIQKLSNKFDELPTVNPADYGAVGDGLTDDSAAIESASEAGIIYGEAGKTYYLGQDTRIVNGAIGANFKINKDSGITGTGSRYFIDCKFHMDRSGLDDGTRGEWCLVIRNTQNMLISGCEFYDTVSCVYLDRIQNGRVENCYFHDVPQTAVNLGGNGYGVLTVQCDTVTICGNKFEDVARHSIYLSYDETSLPNRNIFIYDNVFEWTSAVEGNTSGFETTIQIRPSDFVDIHDNVFIGLQSGVTMLKQTIPLTQQIRGTKDVKIHNNIFYGLKNTARPGDGVVFGSSEGADAKNSATPEIERVTVENNTCDNCLVPLFRSTQGRDIYLIDNTMIGTVGAAKYCIICTDQTDTRHIYSLYVKGNKLVGGSAYCFNITGTVTSELIIDALHIEDNEIDCTGLITFPENGAKVTDFVFKNNRVKATLVDSYSNNVKPINVYASGNSGNVNEKWRADYSESTFYDWDNFLDRITPSLITTAMRRGALIAASDNKFYAVSWNGTVTEL